MLCVQGRVCAGVYSSLVFRKPDVKPRDNSTTATAHRGTTAQHQDTAQRGTGPQRDQPRRRVIENQPRTGSQLRGGAGRGAEEGSGGGGVTEEEEETLPGLSCHVSLTQLPTFECFHIFMN